MSFTILASSAASPALATISANFPSVSMAVISSIATLPTLISVPIVILTGGLVGRRVGYRTFSVLGLVLSCIGGFIPYLANSIWGIFLGRAVLGLGLGFITPIASTLTLLIFSGPEAQTLLGQNSMATNVGAIIFQTAGGILCNINWRLPFLSYVLILPVIIIILFLLPEPEKVQEFADDAGKNKLRLSEVLTGHIFFWCTVNLLFTLFFYGFVTTMSSVVMENSFGDSAMAANVLSVFTASGVVGGFLFSRFVKLLGQRVCSLSFVLLALGYVFAVFANNLTLLFVSAVVFGLGFGMQMPSTSLYLGKPLADKLKAPAFAAYGIFGAIGSFSSSYFIQLLRNVFNISYDRFAFAVGAGVFFVGAAFFLFYRKEKVRVAES